MDPQRTQAYEELEGRIGNTPLVRFEGRIPNGNSIWIKRECDNPFGSHYDRVYLALFRHSEELGKIQPGAKVIETTSGAAGASFAGIGKLLGYECFVALPAGGERAREEAIREHLRSPDHLIFTAADRYISGFPAFLRHFLAEHRDLFFMNHSMGPRDTSTELFSNNEVTLNGMEGIGRESLGQIDVDYFIPAVGNGSSVLGPGRALKHGTKIVPFEPFQSAVAYDLMYPGRYYTRFGILPGTLPRHRLPGTSYPGIDFPHIRNAVHGWLIEDIILVSDAKTDQEYEQVTGRQDTWRLPHWDVLFPGHEDLGRTGRAGIAVALRLAEKATGKNFLVIAYDKASRYDS
ncbi:MAG: pyridoxal-phosphate dependent enzyme [Nanoarchaeota archaeon]